MMKNNKGFTVVELIVTFVFVMLISIGMMSLVNSYRENSQKEVVRKSMNIYKNQIVKAIQDDIYLYQIEKIENLTETDLPGYDRGLRFTFKAKKSDSTTPITKDLKVLNKGTTEVYNIEGDTENVNIEKAKIEYDGVVYTAPDKFVNLISDTMIYTEPNVSYTTGIEHIKTFYSINIKIKNEDINEDFDIHIVCIGPSN